MFISTWISQWASERESGVNHYSFMPKMSPCFHQLASLFLESLEVDDGRAACLLFCVVAFRPALARSRTRWAYVCRISLAIPSLPESYVQSEGGGDWSSRSTANWARHHWHIGQNGTRSYHTHAESFSWDDGIESSRPLRQTDARSFDD